MVDLKNVFKEVKVPRPQISTRAAYSTTPAQRRKYIGDITKARGKAMEYNKYISQQRSEYIKNQEEFQRRLANIKKASQQYETSRSEIASEIASLRQYEANLKSQQAKLEAEKRRSRSSSSRSRGESFMSWMSKQPINPIFKQTSGYVSRPKPSKAQRFLTHDISGKKQPTILDRLFR